MNTQDISRMLSDKFDVSMERGFLPSDDPMTGLPTEPPGDYSMVDKVGMELSSHLRNGTLEEAIKEIPIFDADDISYLMLPDAHLLMARLQFLANAWVNEKWREGILRQYLPANIAVPLRALADIFGCCSTLEYRHYALYNWYRKDPDGPITPENLKLIQNFLGGESEEWFVVIHIAIEYAAAPLLVACWGIGDAIEEVDDDALHTHLQVIKSALLEINSIMLRMKQHCDPREYFQFVRPYLYGSNDKVKFPNGLLYEGRTPAENEYLAFPGETGAQSSIVPSLDRVLGITHEKSELSDHLYEMLHVCTPTKQRNFVLALEKRKGLSAETVCTYGTEIENLYWECRELLAEFRNTHLRYAVNYIEKPARGVSKDLKYLGAIGSGGTKYMPSLKKHLDETR